MINNLSLYIIAVVVSEGCILLWIVVVWLVLISQRIAFGCIAIIQNLCSINLVDWSLIHYSSPSILKIYSFLSRSRILLGFHIFTRFRVIFLFSIITCGLILHSVLVVCRIFILRAIVLSWVSWSWFIFFFDRC